MDDRDDWHLTDDIEHERGAGDPFAAAVRATRMPMVITDPNRPDNPIIFCNRAFQELTGYAREEIVGRNCRFLQGPDTDRAEVARVRRAIEHGEDVAADLLNYRKDGSTFWNALYLSPVRNAAGDIQFFFASQLDISDRVEAQRRIAEQKAIVEREVEARTADLQAALETKTLLLHEVDHRVKNNLTMIGSLLRLQARSIGEPAVAARLEAMLERVDALATVHRRLYQSDDVTRFDIGAFARNLVDDMIGINGGAIRPVVDVEPVMVPAGAASALGLVLNEIVTNAVKHGYRDERAGVLRVVAGIENGRGRVSVADDGPGLPDAATARRGLGMVLISRLAAQAGAKVDWQDTAPGTRVVVTFDAMPA